MRKKVRSGFKYVLEVTSPKGTQEITTLRMHDQKDNVALTEEQIIKRGVKKFSNFESFVEGVNHFLGGDAKKMVFIWNNSTSGIAFIYD